MKFNIPAGYGNDEFSSVRLKLKLAEDCTDTDLNSGKENTSKDSDGKSTRKSTRKKHAPPSMGLRSNEDTDDESLPLSKISSIALSEPPKSNMTVAEYKQKGWQELESRLGGRQGKLHPQQGDISKEADLERVFGWVEQHLGPVAVMINNAATNHPANFDDLEHQKMFELVNTNVLGTAAACSRALKSMKTHSIKDGHIVNVSSILGHGQGVTRYALEVYPITLYCATKHAITGLSRAIRAELLKTHPDGFNIRVTNLCPGLVKTNMSDKVMKGNFGDRYLLPGDLARALHFVLSSPPTVEISEIIVQPTGEVY